MAVHAWGPPTDPSIRGSLEIDVAAALALIDDLRRTTGAHVTLTHLVGRAVALAIRERPEVNAVLRFGRVYRRDAIDVYFLVSMDGGEDLNGQKIACADRKGIVEISRELQDHAREVRARRTLGVRATGLFSKVPAPLVGLAVKATTFAIYDLGLDLSPLGIPFDPFGSAMITNVGSFGIGAGYAALFPIGRSPIIVLVGEVEERAVVRDGAVVARPILPVGVTLDHRFLDGYQAGVLARRFRQLMADPRRLVEAN